MEIYVFVLTVKNMSDNDNISSEFVIETLDGYGRVMVASRDILPWELVLEDTCLVMAPNDVPVCLGCLGQVSTIIGH